MEFTCCNCEKPILSMALLLDKKYFLHEHCKEEFEAQFLEAENEEDAEDLIET